MDMIYMLPFLINKNGSDFIYDSKMSDDFFKSLEKCKYKILLIYNQGCLSNQELSYYLSKFNINYEIIGNGENDGIAFSRYSMINHIKKNYNNIKYVAEVHLDMIFTPNWDKPLIDFLLKTNEPIVSPRIVYFEDNLYKVTGREESFIFPESLEEKIEMMESLIEEKIDYGFVHPAIHNFNILKRINAYDIRFLTGKQGYEDDSIILGYNYYMGTKENWKPKIYCKSCVYHRTIGQRAKINNFYEYAWASKFVEEKDICLDAGCGAIHPFKYYLASICHEVHAVDIDSTILDKEEIINKQKQYFSDEEVMLSERYLDKLLLKNEDLRNLKYEDEFFNKIYCISVLHLIEENNIIDILKELKRVLKSNGLLVITVDVPTTNIEKLINNINQVGLKLKNNLDLIQYEGIIYSDIVEGLNCFRILVTK
ncbi:class I SAM-dependent methyltransferase [Clostridium sp. AL.422]|uniref:class I SAM-dependent methyltransferase n=1 Tax=Clostridium TaxID=1485 RepID=UPI00293DA33F|nr:MULTISPECIES: class I SAM-dependent methyltransferase [unclassified Clostridium]MDV4149571.1 class I SAM-dependent methyltransferase [Clostridium sp. AL.422]